jgi:hypothetical protein
MLVSNTQLKNYLFQNYVFFITSGVGLIPLHCGQFWPIVPAPDDRWGWLWSNWWNEKRQGKPKYSEKTCPKATLSTTNHTWPDPGSNPGPRGGKPATNRLSYGAALYCSRPITCILVKLLLQFIIVILNCKLSHVLVNNFFVLSLHVWHTRNCIALPYFLLYLIFFPTINCISESLVTRQHLHNFSFIRSNLS